MNAGTRVGPYEVVERIGAGGMGEVYRARDARLGRDVAIKILPPAFTSDPDRLARFAREARLLAALNHPNIATIHGVEESDGVRALVMELVPGGTLTDRIAGALGHGHQRVGLPLAEALHIARQLAEALDAAHEKGIVHRDLKPANIKITPAGVVKVLDFGLAKAAFDDRSSADLTQSPTMTVAGTREGVILGTAAYMSPEQARGQTVDKRTDIWAFGCVLYEMLTGRAAFARDTITDTLAALIEREPDWTALPSDTPPRVGRLLARCLEKDPRRRVRDIGDVRMEFEGDPHPPTAASPPPRIRALVWTAVLAVVAAIVSAAAALVMVRSRAEQPLWIADAVTLSIDIPASTTLTQNAPVLSADGRQVAWVASSSDGRTHIWTQTLTAGAPRDLPGTDGGGSPFWSPDGRSLGFLAQGQLKRMELATGRISPIAIAPDVSSGATWSTDNVIVFAARYGIFSVPASGGTPTQVATLNRQMQENQLLYPQFLPDNRHFLYAARSGRPEKSGAYLGSLDGKAVRLLSTTSFARYAPPGYLLTVRDGALIALPFNINTLSVGVEATTIVERIAIQGGMNGRFDVSQNGVLAFFVRPSSADQVLRWFDRSGKSLEPLTEAGTFNYFRVAPDGHRVVLDRVEGSGARSIWIYDAGGGPPTRMTFGGVDEWVPLWSPDGQRVAFMSYRDGPGDIYIKSLSTSAPEEPLRDPKSVTV